MKAPVYIRDHIESLVRLIRAQAQAVGAQVHNNALHDLRVCVRRLRSALRTTRGLYDAKRLKDIQTRLRKVTQETNILRDAEVTLPRLREIKLDGENQPGLDAWIGRLQTEADEKRAHVTAEMVNEPLDKLLANIDALMAAPPVAHGGRTAGKHAGALLKKECKRVRRMLEDAPEQTGDPARMHALRIACKRLRYTAEFYAPVLGREAEMWAKAARRVQQTLGALHDLDILMEMTRQNADLPDKTKSALLGILDEKRETQARHSIETLKAARRKLK